MSPAAVTPPRRARPIVLVAVVLLVSCGARMGGGTTGGRSGVPGSAVGFARPPVIDGSREACLLPPFAPDPSLTALPDGSLVTHASGSRSWEFKLPGSRDATQPEMQELLTRLRAQSPANAYLSHGLYCGGGARLCFHWAGNLCEARVEERLAWFRQLVRADGVLADARLELVVELAGHVGPRCRAADAACEPTPYEGGSYDPSRGRNAGTLATHSGGACTHDGDCQVMGCGNHCLSWEYGGANEGATCEGYALSSPIFCGCVDGRCAWFSQ